MPDEPMWSPLPEDWGRALAVVAHPDDLEFGASSAIARWSAQGKEVHELLVTRGEAGIDTVPPAECSRLRTDEQMAAARAVGAAGAEFLDFPDGTLEYSLKLRHALARSIRTHRPNVIISLNFRETWPGGAGFNHADHRVLGPALLDAARDAANRWVFADLASEGLMPWSGVDFAAFSNSPASAHYVPLSGAQLDAGLASLAAHEVYLANLEDFDSERFLRDNARAAGQRCGTELAATFEVVRI